MNVLEIKDFLRRRPGYIKFGSYKLSKVLQASKSNCEEALSQMRREIKQGIQLPSKPNNPKRLFYDIETSYNIVKAWRVGYNMTLQPGDIIHERAIICLSYKWEGEDKVHTLRWNKGCDKDIITKFVELMFQADELVGHNIDRFDTKWIMTRAIKHGIEVLPKYNSYDTLKKAKFKFNFNSNKLDYIAKFLGLGGKYEHPGMKMWDDIILRNDPEAMAEMVYYCEKDVMLTEEVYQRLRKYTEHNVHHGVLMDKPKFTCPNDGSENVELVRTDVTKTGTIKRLMKCNDCGQMFYLSNTQYLKFLNN
jgi:hypothetical protein